MRQGCLVYLLWLIVVPAAICDEPIHYFGIRLVDDQTGAGVPLVRLTTTGAIDHWTDSQGWIAFDEPGLMDREVFFSIDSPGYEYPKDGFGIAGVQLMTTPGKTHVVKLQRSQLAQRLYRVTGQGIFRDSQLLDKAYPTLVPPINAGVIGSDSVQAVLFRDRVFWLWGDTNLPHYPLGNFRVTAATSPMPNAGGFDPRVGVPLTYFLDENSTRVRGMILDDAPGAVWLFGLIDVTDGKTGDPCLVAHYSRHRSLGDMVEHGIARFNPQKKLFEKIATFDSKNTWQFPRGNAVKVIEPDGEYVYFAEPFATTRVRANLDSLVAPDQYEALAFDVATRQWLWQKTHQPMTQTVEREWIDQRKATRGPCQISIDRCGYENYD